MTIQTIYEIEVATAASVSAARRFEGRFLKGPIPLNEIARAANLPGRALSVFLAIHHQCALTRRTEVTLPKALLSALGVDKDAKARALRALEGARMVHIERTKGTAVRISLCKQ